MLHCVVLRSALAVAVSDTVPPPTPAVLLEARSMPSQVPDAVSEVGLSDSEVAWPAGACGTSWATTERVPAEGSISEVLQTEPWLQKVSRCPELASFSSMR